MARSTIERRHDAERERNARYDAVLRQPRMREAFDIDVTIRSVMAGRWDQAIRDPRGLRLRLKTKDPGKIALALARHVYATFPVPAHLESVWLDREPLEPTELERRKDWYVEVAQGRSLYRGRTKGTLTRLETHNFLYPAPGLGFREALWYAVARSYTDNIGLALRIARSKVARDSVIPFWRDAARFFCANPIPITDINDLCDFLAALQRGNPGYSLAGRTLRSLRAGMEQWHRELGLLRRIGTGSWDGNPLPDWTWEEIHENEPHRNVTWTVTQLKTGKELAAEGSRMRHCVYSYKQECMRGHASIWSLRATNASGTKRVLTMEMTVANDVIQVRGLANRRASAAELSILRRWSIATGVTIR
jgi:hypothetical protein